MDTVTVFQDAAGQWRWHRQAENFRVIATSGEGYKNRADCLAMAQHVNGEGPEYHVQERGA